MNYMLTILLQVIVMFLLAAVGYLMFKGGKISQEGSKSLGNILIYLSLPCVIINSFLVERTPERLSGFFLSAAMAAAALGLAMLISRLALGRSAIDNFAGSFSNPSFFGIPLITASIGSENIFYIAPFIAFLNLLQWTYGVSLLEASDDNGMLPARGKQKGTASMKPVALLQRLFKAPFMIAVFVGLFFFLTGLPMPSIAQKCITSIAGLNTPIAMFTIGIYLAQTDIRRMFARRSLYRVALVRMVLIPAVTLALLSLLKPSLNGMRLAILIASACPVGSNVAVYAQLYNRDYPYAVETVIISTLISIVTLPLFAGLAGAIW